MRKRRVPLRPQRLDRREDRRRGEDHPRPTAVRLVVDLAMRVLAELAQVHDPQVEDAPLHRAADERLVEWGGEIARKERHDVEAHARSLVQEARRAERGRRALPRRPPTRRSGGRRGRLEDLEPFRRREEAVRRRPAAPSRGRDDGRTRRRPRRPRPPSDRRSPSRSRRDVLRAHAQLRIPQRFGLRNVRNSFEGEENAALMRAHRHDAGLSRLVRTAGELDS